MSKFKDQRATLREIYHMEDHADAAAGALERKDIPAAETSLNMLRGILTGVKKREEEAGRKDDGK